MAAMLEPKFDRDYDAHETTTAPVDVLPGVEGLKPGMLVATMFVGAGMWGVLFYVGSLIINLFTG